VARHVHARARFPPVAADPVSPHPVVVLPSHRAAPAHTHVAALPLATHISPGTVFLLHMCRQVCHVLLHMHMKVGNVLRHG